MPRDGELYNFFSADGCDIKIKGTVPTHCQIEFNADREVWTDIFCIHETCKTENIM